MESVIYAKMRPLSGIVLHHPIIQQSTLMIYGDRDVVAKSENLTKFVPNVEVVNLDCGHWIQEEKPEETNQAILRWLEQQDAT